VRPKIGEIGLRCKYLDFDSILYIIRNARIGEEFGKTALRIGVLSQSQLNILLGHQRRLGFPIGRFFIESGLLTAAELERFLRKKAKHNIGIVER
jgi:hypothetical protein